ncbi:hypothetical protein [Tortoise microvirus 90]|nr:hypothetical protein [Tortoise microvirus 90]
MSTTFALGEQSTDLEKSGGISQTVPDQSLSLRELVTRQSQGLPIPMKHPIFSDQEIPDLKKLDLAEIQELKEVAASQVNSLRQKLQQAELAERQAVLAEKQKNLDKAASAANQPPPAPPAQNSGVAAT